MQLVYSTLLDVDSRLLQIRPDACVSRGLDCVGGIKDNVENRQLLAARLPEEKTSSEDRTQCPFLVHLPHLGKLKFACLLQRGLVSQSTLALVELADFQAAPLIPWTAYLPLPFQGWPS